MKIDKFIQKTSNLHAENRLLKFVVVCLGIAVVLSSFFSYIALHYQRVVILPPVVDKRVVISGNDVNEDYVRLFVRYAMNLLNNYTPNVARSQFEELLNLATPSFYPALQKTLMNLADTIKRLNITGAYYPQKVEIDTKRKIITVVGRKKEFTNTTLVDTGLKKYIIKYAIVNGRFYFDDLKEEEIKK
ncbi:MAG: pilus assembly protein [Aquificota bacterium]|nr:MAG: pilus assembly protein [Aquificota bacterium]